MRRSLAVLFVFFLFGFSKPSKAQCPPNTFLPATGMWSSAANWSCGNVPDDGEYVLIPAGKVCTLDVVTPLLSNTIIWLFGELYFECGKKLILDCNSALVVWPGGVMDGACVGSKLEYCGDFVWDGGDPPVMGPASFPASALPIELVAFTGWYDGTASNIIEWKTASETNNDFFTLEKSSDGINFEVLGHIDGAGTTSQTTYYQFSDDSPYFPLTYYRLEQTDIGGTDSTYSQIISVVIDKSATGFRLFPNPALTTSLIRMTVPAAIQGKEILVVVVDILGKELYSKVILEGTYGNSLIAIEPGANLPPGVYTILANSGDSRHQQKLVIQ